MKKQIFSGLISCSLLMAAAQTNGQTSLQAAPNNENVVILRWSTSNEPNVDRYVIEKSTDSILFNPLHEVIAPGTVVAPNDSVYLDEDPYPATPTNYYRLVTIFRDGNSVYSPVARVDMSNPRAPLLHPTVLDIGGTLRMDNFYDQPLIVDFYTEGGAHLATCMVNSPTFNINTASLNHGVFIYRISDEHHAFINTGKILLQ